MKEDWLPPYLDRMDEIIRRLSRYFHGRIEAAGGLSPSQFFVLKLLARDGTLTVSEVAHRLGMTAAGATGLVDRLVRSGLVSRTRDEVDRRVVQVCLSEQGVRRLDEACTLRREILGEYVGALSPAEVETLVALFDKMAHNLPFMVELESYEKNDKEQLTDG